MTWLDDLAEKALARELPARAEALEVLRSGDDELMDVVAAAFRVRLRWFGRRVKLNYLVNIKSGLCPEDCFYCSQRAGSAADVLKYTWLKPGEILKTSEAGVQAGAKRVCLVASGRGPTDADITRVCGAVTPFKEQHPDVEVCACLGLLSDGQAERLHRAGTTAYNHNLNTAESNYSDICTTHSYADRADTVRRAKHAGLSPCSGLIAGLGETDEELVNVVFALRELDPDSVPVNFLIPFEGTPLGGEWSLTPQRCLRILALVRFVCPDAEEPAAARPAHRQLDLPRRLPDQRRPARRPRPGDDRRRRLQRRRGAAADPARAPARPGPRPPPRRGHHAARECLIRGSRTPPGPGRGDHLGPGHRGGGPRRAPGAASGRDDQRRGPRTLLPVRLPRLAPVSLHGCALSRHRAYVLGAVDSSRYVCEYGDPCPQRICPPAWRAGRGCSRGALTSLGPLRHRQVGRGKAARPVRVPEKRKRTAGSPRPGRVRRRAVRRGAGRPGAARRRRATPSRSWSSGPAT